MIAKYCVHQYTMWEQDQWQPTIHLNKCQHTQITPSLKKDNTRPKTVSSLLVYCWKICLISACSSLNCSNFGLPSLQAPAPSLCWVNGNILSTTSPRDIAQVVLINVEPILSSKFCDVEPKL